MKPRTALPLVTALLPAALIAQQTVQIPARDKPLSEPMPVQFSIGAEDGEEWELLSGVRQVAFDSRDHLYVLDGNNHRVLVFDPNGRFLRKIGKKGEGPGELMGPVAMTVANDGSVVISDIGRRAFSVFKPDGSYDRNIMFDEGEMVMGGPDGRLLAHPRGGVVGRTQQMMMIRGGPGGAAPGGPTGPRTAEVKWWDLGTGKTTELFEFTLPTVEPKVEQSGSSGGRTTFVARINPPRWTAPAMYTLLANGSVAVVRDKGYRVEIGGAGGKVERLITRGIEPRKGTDRDKRRSVEAQRAVMASGAGGGMQVRVANGATSVTPSSGAPRDLPSVDEMLKDAIFEETIPVLSRIAGDPQGRLWIARTPADFGPSGPIDLVRSDGTYIGTIPDARVPDAVSRTGRAAWVERDDLGVEKVVVRRLPAAWN